MRTTTTMRAAVALAGLFLGACASNPRLGVAYAHRGPPVERVEVISVSPGRDQVWIKGHWAWRGGDYDWISGHWSAPERGYREWIPGRWEHDRHGWFYVEGRWR